MSDGGGGDGGGGSASGGGVLARLLAALWGDPSSSGQQQAAEFRREFESSYGGVHPDFFAGDFKGAWGAAHAQYRFLALYLHSASHQDTPDFCRDVLCKPEVASYISEHFVFWAGDVSQPDAYRLSSRMGVPGYPFLAVVLCLKHNPEGAVQFLLHPLPEDPQLRALGVQQPRQPLLLKCEQYSGAPGSAEQLLGQLRRVVENESIHLTAARLEAEELRLGRSVPTMRWPRRRAMPCHPAHEQPARRARQCPGEMGGGARRGVGWAVGAGCRVVLSVHPAPTEVGCVAAVARRREMREEQDQAYSEALRADEEKERQRVEAEAEVARQAERAASASVARVGPFLSFLACSGSPCLRRCVRGASIGGAAGGAARPPRRAHRAPAR
jgi:hypothetical protein